MSPDGINPLRGCDSCTLCCKVLRIDALAKPPGKWCEHCKMGSGCSIYSMRPDECQKFYCGFLTWPELGEYWKPSQSKIVLTFDGEGNRIVAYVDPQRPGAWREPKVYGDLKLWSRRAVQNRGQVLIKINRRIISVLPDDDVDLGDLEDDDIIAVEVIEDGLSLPRYRPFVMKRDDPRTPSMK